MPRNQLSPKLQREFKNRRSRGRRANVRNKNEGKDRHETRENSRGFHSSELADVGLVENRRSNLAVS